MEILKHLKHMKPVFKVILMAVAYLATFIQEADFHFAVRGNGVSKKRVITIVGDKNYMGVLHDVHLCFSYNLSE